ncbi:hypothetical protein BD289DRAFT_481483 [Coniella lustricola]|uniref:Uncharacterized protein n=1 Tax=Coniella lustricola TaxID=2025994 RepID=A0A2T3AC54_9PEZI|nr:hypothetical protein BD289DRAFT_481483 [Coniella lustricola]
MSASQNQGQDASSNTSYKERLDEAADKSRYPNQDVVQNRPGVVTQVMEKVSQYVPGAEIILGGQRRNTATDDNKTTNGVPDSSVPPVRPHHDRQIEEFVRAQHGSNLGDVKGTDD